MPRVRPLTQEQRYERDYNDTCKTLIDALNMKRGLSRKSTKSFSQQIGVSVPTWWRWNGERGLDGASFGSVLNACIRAGLKIKIEM
ncbi:MAG: hypothetical protein LIO57_04185 [Oscillospiraceae bacterium]|nr:hypothetical protein [Oscillospiraceae bacterium]